MNRKQIKLDAVLIPIRGKCPEIRIRSNNRRAVSGLNKLLGTHRNGVNMCWYEFGIEAKKAGNGKIDVICRLQEVGLSAI